MTPLEEVKHFIKYSQSYPSGYSIALLLYCWCSTHPVNLLFLMRSSLWALYPIKPMVPEQDGCVVSTLSRLANTTLDTIYPDSLQFHTQKGFSVPPECRLCPKYPATISSYRFDWKGRRAKYWIDGRCEQRRRETEFRHFVICCCWRVSDVWLLISESV